MNNGYGSDMSHGTRLVGQLGEAGLNVVTTQPIAPMASSLRSLEQRIDQLGQAVAVLAGKLDPIMKNEPPSAAVAGAQAARARSSSNLGATLDNHTDQIESITDNVNSLIRRCEL